MNKWLQAFGDIHYVVYFIDGNGKVAVILTDIEDHTAHVMDT